MKIIKLLIMLSSASLMISGGLTVLVCTRENPSVIMVSLYLLSIVISGILLGILENKIEDIDKNKN